MDALMSTKDGPTRGRPRQDPYRKARAAFSAAYMSNAKWRKVFAALATMDLKTGRMQLKLIDSDHVEDHGQPRLKDVLDTRFEDGQFQPVAYKWIEWVHFPRSYRPHGHLPYEVTQDVQAIKAVLDKCGRLMLRLDESGLTLLAYEH
jgi:hypothetical protein